MRAMSVCAHIVNVFSIIVFANVWFYVATLDKSIAFAIFIVTLIMYIYIYIDCFLLLLTPLMCFVCVI